MTAHQLGVRVTVTTVYPGQDFGVVAVGADLVSVSSVSYRVYTEGRLKVPEPLPRAGVNRTWPHTARLHRSWPSACGPTCERHRAVGGGDTLQPAATAPRAKSRSQVAKSSDCASILNAVARWTAS